MWVVCKYKDNSGYYISRRSVRETMLSVLLDLGQQPDSFVLKEFEKYSDADKYKKEMERIDKDIDNLNSKT